MDIKYRCVRCQSLHDEYESALECCSQIQRVAVCGKCNFKTMSPSVADGHKCEDEK